MKEAYIVDAVRTPIGNFRGALAPVRADDLAAIAIKSLLEKHQIWYINNQLNSPDSHRD